MLHANFMFFNFSFLHVNISEMKRSEVSRVSLFKCKENHQVFILSFFILLFARFHLTPPMQQHTQLARMKRTGRGWKLYPKRFFLLFFFSFSPRSHFSVFRRLLRYLMLQQSQFTFHFLSMLKVINCNVQINKIPLFTWSVYVLQHESAHCTLFASRFSFSLASHLNNTFRKLFCNLENYRVSVVYKCAQ